MSNLQQTADRLLAAFNSHDPVAVAALYASNQVTILPGEEPVRGRSGKTALLTGFFTAFPDLALELTLVLTSGRHIVCEGTMAGTNTGPLSSHEGVVPATGRRVSLPTVYILELDEDGLIREDRTYFDNRAFQEQLSHS